MADEDQMVTDEDLDRAAELAPDASETEPEVDDGNNADDDTAAAQATEETEEVVIEEEQETLPVEPEDNTVRSELGRKVKEQGETLTAFMDSITGAISEIKTMVAKPAVEEEEDDEEPLYLTRKQFNQMADERLAKKGVVTKADIDAEKRQHTEYERGYMSTVGSLMSEVSEQDKAEIEKELFENKEINLKRSGIPKMDAEMNFLKAQTNVLRRQVVVGKKPVNPLEKNKDNPDLLLGGPSGTRNQETKSAKVIKVNSEAAAFAKASGMTDEEVQETLSGPMPTYLGG